MKHLMHSRSLLFALLISTTSVLSGCGEDPDENVDDGVFGIDDLGREFINARCKWLTTCGSFPDIDTCKDSTADLSDQTAEDVNAGLAEFDADKALECLALFEGLDCSRFGLIEGAEVCDQTLTGLVPLGGECFNGGVCAGNASCDGAERGTCTPGVCAERAPDAKENEACGDVDCEGELRCNADNICVVPPELGEDCSGQLLECVRSVCELGASDTAAGLCVELPQTGETCDGQVYGGRLSCHDMDDFCDRMDNTCKDKIQPGGTCSIINFDTCVDYAECVGSTCVALPQPGDGCTANGPVSCLGDLDCINGECALGPEPEVCTL